MGKGDFLLRLDPEDLERVRKAAADEGLTASDFIRQGVELRMQQAGTPRSETRESLLAEIADTAAKLGRGYVLMPVAEVPPSERPGSWSGLLDEEGH